MLDIKNRTLVSIALLVVLVVASVYFWVKIPAGIADGTYSASAQGFSGELNLEVTFFDGEMTEIEVLSHEDTPIFADMAIGQVIPAIIEAQSTDVDVATGATFTSNAIKDAVSQILADN